MFNSSFIWIGVIVVIFILCIALLIFAPKGKNYFNSNIYPIVKYLHENNLQTFKDDFKKIKDENWVNYTIDVQGKCGMCPLYMFSITSKKNTKLCQNTYDLVHNIPDLKTCTYMIIHPKSQILKNKGWKDLANNTLRCAVIINSMTSTMDKCGIWVNGQTKKIKANDLLIFDASKEYSIYNHTPLNLELLIFDIKRPDNIACGLSERLYSNKLQGFISKINI